MNIIFRILLTCTQGPHEVWDLYVFDGVEAAAATGSKMCDRTFFPAHCYRDPNDIFRHIPWVVLVCRAKYRLNGSRSHKITAILNKRITFSHFFSKSILVIPMKLGRDIALSEGHLVREYGLK